MEKKTQLKQCNYILNKLCVEIPDRSVGSEGNRKATDFFLEEISKMDWQTETAELSVMDWENTEASVSVEDKAFEVFASPYSLGCTMEAPLRCISTAQELERSDITGKIVLMHGEIAKEQIMPKNFVFYNPESHQKIISLLEAKQPKAIITATGRNSSIAGGVYPFPLFEDGDFNIPSIYMTQEEGEGLIGYEGKPVQFHSSSTRKPAKAYNVVAKKGTASTQRIIITAHIDAKKGTPGAIDNATGVAVLLLTADLLKEYQGNKSIEIVAFNGEDYYAVPGQMHYIKQNHGQFENILLNINIDGAGYKEGPTAFSLFNLPNRIEENVQEIINTFDGITEGIQWVQGDHSIFVQFGCPALAISSKWFIDNMENQEITHTAKDNINIVNTERIVEIAEAVAALIKRL